MAIVDRNSLKSYFQTGDQPTEAQFANFIDSVIIKGEDAINWDDLSANVKAIINNIRNPNRHWQITSCVIQADMYRVVPTDFVLLNSGLTIRNQTSQAVTVFGKTFQKKGVLQVAGDVLLQYCEAEINGDLYVGGCLYLSNTFITGTGIIY